MMICDWAWASVITFFYELIFQNAVSRICGFGNFISIMYAIECGACEIDVILLEDENEQKRRNNY
jgi:hypothetical protein